MSPPPRPAGVRCANDVLGSLTPDSLSPDEQDAVAARLRDVPAAVVVGSVGPEASFRMLRWVVASSLVHGVWSPLLAACSIADAEFYELDDPAGVVARMNDLVDHVTPSVEGRGAPSTASRATIQREPRETPRQGP